MIARWLALALLLVLPIDALAENCTFAATGFWTSAINYDGGDDCALDATDNIIIPTGVVATITTGSTVSLTTGAITVQSGGSLVLQRSATLAVPDGGLAVQSGGSFTPRGAAVSYGDATPSFVTSLASAIGPANGDINTVVPLGKIIHCPGVSAGVNATSATALVPDCLGVQLGEAGTRDEMAVCWPDANVGADLLGGYDVGTGTTGQQFYAEWLAQIAAGDVLLFWDPTNQRPSADVNSQYLVTFVNTQAANRCIGLSVRQGSSQQSCAASSTGCLLADRDIRECTVTGTYSAGARTLQCAATDFTTANQRTGRVLTCPADKDRSGAIDGTVNNPDFQSARITSTTAADVVRLMPGGLPYNVPNLALCYVDYGWRPGDLVSVYKPAALTQGQNATCVDAGNPVACCSGANFGTCGALTCQRGASCDFDFTTLNRVGRVHVWPTTTMDNTWLRDIASDMQIGVFEGAGPFNRVQLTSPAWDGSTVGAANEHGVGVSGGGTSVFNDVVLRHWGDDAFCPNWCIVAGGGTTCDGSNGGSLNTALSYGHSIKRLRAEYAGCKGGSCALFDECGPSAGGGGPGGGPVIYDVSDMLAIDATEHTVANGQMNLTNDDVATGKMKLRNVAMVANLSPLLEPPAASRSRLELLNYYDIGRALTSSTSYHNVAAHTISDASLVEMANSAAVSAVPLMANTLLRAAAGPVDWRRVLVLDPDVPGATPNNMFQLDDAPAEIAITDFAIISPNRTGQADEDTMLRLASQSGTSLVPIRLNRFTVGMRPGETTEFTSFFYASTSSGIAGINGGWRTLQNALSAFVWRTSALSLTAYTTDGSHDELVTTRPSPYCDVGSSTPWGGSIPGSLTTGVRDVRQSFVDPSLGNFEPARGSWASAFGCGARKVGARDMWALRVLGHDIYAGYGDTWKVKSGGGSKRGPRATP